MDKIAIFPGSFDPFTIGHESIVRRALPMFDKIIIMIGYNTNKQSFFKLSQRINWIRQVFADEPKIEVREHEGLTVDFCKVVGASYILRGLRTSSDFEYERAIAQMNKKLYPAIETVFLLTMPEHTPINSSIVRDIIRHGGDAGMFLPKALNRDEFIREEDE
jgi:pantetheine-phosphate adenylyltransferase